MRRFPACLLGLACILAAGTPAAAAPVFIGTDTATKGTWSGTYGADGYALANWNGAVSTVTSPPQDLLSLPPYISGISYSGGPQGYRWPDAQVTQANRLQDPSFPGDPTKRRPTVSFGANWTTTLTFSEARDITLSVYFLQTDTESRVQTYTVGDGGGTSAQTTPGNAVPTWYRWQVSGAQGSPVTINARFLSGTGGNAVLSAIMFDPASGPPPPPPTGTLLLDNFNNTVDADALQPDYGLNNGEQLALRQSGAFAPLTYSRNPTVGPELHQVNHTQAPYSAPGRLSLFALSGNNPWVVLNRDFPADVTVSASLDPVAGDTASTDWMSVGLRGQATSFSNNAYLPNSTNAGVLFLIGSNGAWSIYENGSSIGVSGTVATAAIYNLVLSTLGDLYEVTVNGVPLDLNGSAPGNSLTLTGAAAGTSNFVTLGGYNQSFGNYRQHLLDDLKIEAVGAVPEPMSLVLLGGGLLALARRRARRRG